MTRNMQLWPGGQSVTVEGEWPDYIVDGVKPDADLARKVRIEGLAEMYRDRDILACQSALVDDLLKRDDIEGFGVDDIENLYPDPSDWSLARCREWIDDNETDHDYANELGIDPWKANDAELAEFVAGDFVRTDQTTNALRDMVLKGLDGGWIDGLDNLREFIRDNAEPQEAYEWWLVSDWLCEKLRGIGEIVIDNGMGHWWGRGCTGQSLIMDGTLQQIAAGYVD